MSRSALSFHRCHRTAIAAVAAMTIACSAASGQPSLATFLGGNGLERTMAIAHAWGKIVVVGHTSSTNFAGTPLGGSDDAFVALIDPSACGAAALVWALRLGGSGSEIAFDVALSGSGATARITVVGYTNSPNFFPPPPATAYQPTKNSVRDGFVTQLDLTGAMRYSTFFGGSGNDFIGAVAVDPSTGFVTVAGYSNSPGLLSTTQGPCGLFDAFVARLDPLQPGAAALLCGTLLGGAGDEGNFTASGPTANPRNWDLIDLHVAASGAVTLAGMTRSTGFPTTTGAYQTTSGGSADMFVTRLPPTLSTLVWSTYLGGPLYDSATCMAVDAAGNVTVGGNTYGSFPTTPSCYLPTFVGGMDGVLARLDSSGQQLRYGTYVGHSTCSTWICDLYAEPSGIVTAAGQTWAYSTVPAAWTGTPGAWIATCPPLGSGFVLRLEPAGRGTSDLHYLSFTGAGTLGTGEFEGCFAIASTENGRAVLAGGTDNPTQLLSCAPQPAYGGGLADTTVQVLDLLPAPVQRYGWSTPVCHPALYTQVNSQPSPGKLTFQLHCNAAPPNAPGALLVGLPLPLPGGNPILGVTPFVAPLVIPAWSSDPSGFARLVIPLPTTLPPVPPLWGIGCQWVWIDTTTCGGLGLQASDALQF